MTTNGKQALVRVLKAAQVLADAGEQPEDVVDWIWSDFKAAVAGARAELREEEALGTQRWRDERHSGG